MHENIILYFLENPQATQQEAAKHFGVTGPWMSQIVNSSMFQARLADYRGEIFSSAIMPLHEKLVALGASAVDRLQEKLLVEQDTEQLLEVADMALARLGYGTAKGTVINNNTQNNTIVNNSDKDLLAEARKINAEHLKSVPPLVPSDDKEKAPLGENLLEYTPAREM